MKKLLSLIVLGGFLLAPLAQASFDANLKYGQRGQAVKEMQEFLVDQGICNITATGNFYALTLKCVKAFQSANGIKVSGYWNQATRDKANAILAADLADSEQEQVGEPWVTPEIPVTQPAPTVDVCLNIEGSQTVVPTGLTRDSGSNCVTPSSQSTPQVNTPVTSSPAPLSPYTEQEVANKYDYYDNGVKVLPIAIGANRDSVGFQCNQLPFDVVFQGSTIMQNCWADIPAEEQTPGLSTKRQYAIVKGLNANTNYGFTIVYHEGGRPDSVFSKTIKTSF